MEINSTVFDQLYPFSYSATIEPKSFDQLEIRSRTAIVMVVVVLFE